MSVEVTIFLRPKRQQAFSMERVVDQFSQKLPSSVKWKVVELPYAKFNLISLIKNGFYARKHRSEINHISGESHYLAFFLPRKNTILTIHDALILDHLRGIKRFIIRWFFFALPVHLVGHVTTISEATKNDLKKWALSSLKHSTIIYDPFVYSKQEAPAPFSRAEGKPVLMTIGTKFNKNIERCIKAAAGIHCKLLMVGRLSEEQKKILDENNIDYENRYNLTEEELHKAYNDSDVLLFPSLGEGFGMPILEAQAFGRPVITSNFSSMPEVAGKSALLVDPHSIESIKDGIKSMIDNRELAFTYRERGYENLSRFSPATIANAYTECYIARKSAL